MALGNVFTYAGLGGTLRLGQGLDRDFGPPRIQPAPPGSGYFVPGGRFGWYLFAGMDGRMMLQNIFLDGNTFQDSHRVDKNLWVADFVGGVAVAAHGVRLSATYVQRTPEFKGQRRPDHFGSLAFVSGCEPPADWGFPRPRQALVLSVPGGTEVIRRYHLRRGRPWKKTSST